MSEIIATVYDMIEDRLRLFLYHTGCLARRESYKIDSEKINDLLIRARNFYYCTSTQ